MHMKGGPCDEPPHPRTTLFFMLIFFTLTMADLSTRDSIFEHEAHRTTIKEAQYSETPQPAGQRRTLLRLNSRGTSAGLTHRNQLVLQRLHLGGERGERTMSPDRWAKRACPASPRWLR